MLKYKLLLPSHDKKLGNDLNHCFCSSKGTWWLWCWCNQWWPAWVHLESTWWEGCIDILRFGTRLRVAWTHGPRLDGGPRMGLFCSPVQLLRGPRCRKSNSWALDVPGVSHLLCRSTLWIASTSLCDFCKNVLSKSWPWTK